MISHPWSCCLLGPCWSICSSIAVISCPMGSIGPDDRVGVCCQASLAFPSCSSSHLCKQEIRMTAWHGQGKNRSVSYSQCLDRCAELKKMDAARTFLHASEKKQNSSWRGMLPHAAPKSYCSCCGRHWNHIFCLEPLLVRHGGTRIT